MKQIKAKRGGGNGNMNIYSDIVSFSRRDHWNYQWVKRHFGISLKPGEEKKYKIIEIK